MTTVVLDGLTKEYTPGVAAVADLRLAVEAGELLVLLGPSGCGKTTTLRLVAGLLRPTRGDLLFDGRSMLATPPEKRGAVMVFQQHTLFPFMSVGDNVAFGLRLKGLSRAEVQAGVAGALAAVQLAGFESRWPDQLSGGQRQRVALARALAVRPKVLLLDEPLSNLEPGLREEVREMIRRLQREAGITTLFVTHDQAEAVAVADRIALLIGGRLRQVGRPRSFYERPADAEVARFFGGVNFLPGVKEGSVVHTGIGPLEVAQAEWPDGRVLVTIRPEAIEIGDNGHNNLPARVRSYSYRGLLAHCSAGVNGAELHVVAPPFRPYREGEQIVLHLPRERICLLPPEETE
ncbi:MAG: ABC transporter ATP-binding protein [Chloroflexi bacterium]|nr:ABC transporter ATP-binding protein [Chloroflexota bacterium]MCI0578027.1 ABC transporter ATP-binding protein [Chloroflexota bacterium]MCI0644759.1 ABC transporter ATP-binding protein [Chloroflexota bacterium]MCI0728664.1 ABC transporter ATP-binding protein [Chloroflexota bacterium]